MESLEYGASTIIFSDNIPIHHEVRLKEFARRRGLLVMGPDCGTVVLHGTGLGFANVTRPGPLSLVAASGTGAQHLMALLDAADTGIRHCLGVGGRDLTQQVAGRSTLAALTALADDDETELIAVVSKPPHPAIAARIKAHAATLGKPVHFAFVGPDHPTLTESAERILTALGRPAPNPWPTWAPTNDDAAEKEAAEHASRHAPHHAPHRAPHRASTIRGLFSGGTLRAEAAAVLGRVGAAGAAAEMVEEQEVGGWGEGESRKLPNSTPTAAPLPTPFTVDLTDFGDDAYTRGRPHPMIDNTLRLRALADAAGDSAIGVVLLDVVLGRGAHLDPGTEIAAAIADLLARRGDVAVVVSLCGTAGDPQGLVRQAEMLAGAGAWVFLSNAEAAEAAARLAVGGPATGGPATGGPAVAGLPR
jgi:FdrA protein